MTQFLVILSSTKKYIIYLLFLPDILKHVSESLNEYRNACILLNHSMKKGRPFGSLKWVMPKKWLRIFKKCAIEFFSVDKECPNEFVLLLNHLKELISCKLSLWFQENHKSPLFNFNQKKKKKVNYTRPSSTIIIITFCPLKFKIRHSILSYWFFYTLPSSFFFSPLSPPSSLPLPPFSFSPSLLSPFSFFLS